MLAGKEIVKLNFGKRDTELLQMMRERLREARQVAARFAGAEADTNEGARPDATP
jgi:chorismate mutase